MLQHLVLALNHISSSAFQRLLYQTIFLVAFYCFLCVGELTVKGPNLKSLVHVQDLHFQFCNNVVTSATIVIKDFKHKTTRRHFSVTLRSKRFQSSYSAKVRGGAKQKWKGEGEGRRGNACLQTPRFWKTPLDILRFGSFVN